MNSHRPDLGEQPWPISPTFRTGPRHKDRDHSVEEIIRFVRHFQRPDIEQLSASSVQRKAVLPAIGGFYSYIDVSSQQKSLDNLDSESELVENQTTQNTMGNIGSQDVNILEIGSDDPEGVNGRNNNSLQCSHTNNNELTLNKKTSQETIPNSFIFKTHAEFNDFPENKSIIRDEQLHTSTAAKHCNSYEKTTFVNSIAPAKDLQFSKSLTLKYCSKSAPNIGPLPRPRVLPQLPPIATCDIPPRPPAPSPSPASPASMSSTDPDDLCHDDTDGHENQVQT